MQTVSRPRFFKAPAELRRWLARHHATATELVVGYYKKGTGRPSITWPESVDQALCFGWIDGVRRSLDAESYTVRFTPRRPRSIWSAVNIKRARELTQLGLMQPAGRRAFEARLEARSSVYAYEQRGQGLAPAYEKQLKANRKAWEFFSAQPPWYQKAAAWWVASAKKEETRLKRLARLIADSAAERTVPPLTRPGTPARKP